MGSKIVKILLALLVLLFNNGLLAVEAADQSPLYSIPFDETDWKYQHALDVLRQGLADAVTLARVVILTGSDCDPSFLRYFQKQDFDFVQSLFGAIAGMKPQDNHDPANTLQTLSTMSPETTMNDWSKLMITFGDTNDIPADLNKPHSRCGVGLRIAKMKFDPQWRRDNWPFDTACYMTLCPGSTLFEYRLDLAGTENPPAWARDAQGTPKEGWSCSGMGDRDGGNMMVVGSTVLHELFHCWAIFWQVEHYDEYIYDAAHYGKTSYWWHKIIDNPDGVPGYGPFKCMKLNELPPDPKTGKSKSLQNADNYVWYALSKYWSWKCGKSFGPSLGGADRSLTARGQIQAPTPPQPIVPEPVPPPVPQASSSAPPPPAPTAAPPLMPRSPSSAPPAAVSSTPQATVKHDYNSPNWNELSIKVGEIIEILQKGTTGWWLFRNARGAQGWAPAANVQEIDAASAGSLASTATSGQATAPQQTTAGQQNATQSDDDIWDACISDDD